MSAETWGDDWLTADDLKGQRECRCLMCNPAPVITDDMRRLAVIEAWEAPLIPARSPIGIALAFSLGWVLMLAGVVVALAGPPASGASIAACFLIAAGGAFVARVIHVTGGAS